MADSESAPAPAPAPTPAAPQTTALPWTCSRLNLEDPVSVRFWPLFHASKAGSFGTAISTLIAAMALIILVVLSQTVISNEGYKRGSAVFVVVVAIIGIMMCAGFSALGLQYTNPEWDTDGNKDKPGIMGTDKHAKVLVDGKEVEQCKGFLEQPWVWILLGPGIVLVIGIIIMIVARRRKTTAGAQSEPKDTDV
jgi:nitrate reductase gamma subunit